MSFKHSTIGIRNCSRLHVTYLTWLTGIVHVNITVYRIITLQQLTKKIIIMCIYKIFYKILISQFEHFHIRRRQLGDIWNENYLSRETMVSILRTQLGTCLIHTNQYALSKFRLRTQLGTCLIHTNQYALSKFRFHFQNVNTSFMLKQNSSTFHRTSNILFQVQIIALL